MFQVNTVVLMQEAKTTSIFLEITLFKKDFSPYIFVCCYSTVNPVLLKYNFIITVFILILSSKSVNKGLVKWVILISAVTFLLFLMQQKIY